MQANFKAERSLGYFQDATISAAKSLSAIVGATTLAKGPVLAIITPLAQAIRWRDDGTAPTATVGYPLAAGAELRYTGVNWQQLQFIEQAATASLNIVLYAGDSSPL